MVFMSVVNAILRFRGASVKRACMKLPHIRELKRSLATPQWFGLGFIQLKVSDRERYHFWHPELPPEVQHEEVHNHRYDFTSTVLRGTLRNEIYSFTVDTQGSSRCLEVSCKPGTDTLVGPVGNINWLMTSIYEEGASYMMRAETLHRSAASGFVVTKLVRNDPRMERATVVAGKDAVLRCPFTTQIEEARLWEMIEQCLVGELVDSETFGNNPEIKMPGYHVRSITKGTLGQPSKIIEEAEELLDAYDQGSKIMEQVELSDLYGAMKAFMDKHHPNLTMHDLERMSEITERAFTNGRR